jgi:hypothetical protein
MFKTILSTIPRSIVDSIFDALLVWNEAILFVW